MKRTDSFLYTILISAVCVLMSCDRTYDPIFEESADERIRTSMAEHKTLLTSAPYGWKAMLYTEAGGGYFYYLRFAEDGNVTMFSDFNETTSSSSKSSTWILKALQKITLSFDTYSYIHLPADPDGDINGGTNGSGLLSDFEFTFVRTSGDSVILKGLRHASEMVLLKSTAEETRRIEEKQIRTLLEETKAYTFANKGLRLQLPDETVLPVAIDVARKMFAVQYLSEDESRIITFHTPFTFSLDGIQLRDPLDAGGHRISTLRWDADNAAYVVELEGPVALVNDESPLILRPSRTLHSVIGREYKSVSLPADPYVNTVPGQSRSFIDVYDAAAGELAVRVTPILLKEFRFIFDPIAKEVAFEVLLAQVQNGQQIYPITAQWVYSYTIDANGTLNLTESRSNENAQAIAFEMRTMLEYLQKDSYTLEYIAGGFNLIGGFYSQQREFSFAGYLGN
jgi:hypothetical protein